MGLPVHRVVQEEDALAKSVGQLLICIHSTLSSVCALLQHLQTSSMTDICHLPLPLFFKFSITLLYLKYKKIKAFCFTTPKDNSVFFVFNYLDV